jgi:hypothetical protein
MSGQALMKSRMKRFPTESGAITTDFERDWLYMPMQQQSQRSTGSPYFSARRGFYKTCAR